jgi:microcin C transport system permease protein
MIPTFIGVTLLVFLVTRFVPGGPVERMLMEAKRAESSRVGGEALSEKQLQSLKSYYQFDKPLLLSYLYWLGNTLRGDLGRSTRYGEDVLLIIGERMPISLFYGLLSLVMVYAVCIPLGIAKAVRHKSGFDTITSVLVFLGYSIPGYVLGAFLVVNVAARTGLFPLGGFVSDDFMTMGPLRKAADLFHHAALPLVSYMIGSFAFMTMMMKNNLMENLASDYVRTALAKGVTYRRAVFKHALRNSLIPIATTIGNNISLILGGSFLIEKIFNIDGMGYLGYTSLLDRDYPVVLGILAVSSLLFMLGNILSDMAVAAVDPRVQFR